MASRAASEAALLAVALLPLRLLSISLHTRFSRPAAALRRARSAAALLAVAALVSAICAVPDAGARPGIPISGDADDAALRSEIEALRLKVAQLGEIAFAHLFLKPLATFLATVVPIRISKGLENLLCMY